MYVERPEDIRPALEKAFASGKTACINVMTDPTTVSPGSVALANLGGLQEPETVDTQTSRLPVAGGWFMPFCASSSRRV